MRRAVAATALLLTSAVVALGAVEVMLRALRYRPALQSRWMLASSNVAPDADVIMIPRTLLAPSFYETTGDAPVVVAIGDSFTQGYPVAPPDSYPAVLERVLAQRGARAAVLNAGMGDSGPDQQLRLLETRLLPRLRPAAVVWSLYANDLWDNVLKSVFTIEGERLRPCSGRRSWLYVRQRLFDLTPLPQSLKLDSYAFDVALKATELGARAAVPRAYGKHPTDWGLRKLALELDEFERLAAARRFTPYVLLIVPQSLYLASADPARWRDHWTAVEHRKLAALVAGRRDAIEGWLGAARAADVFADERRDASALGDRHLNEAGYAALAELVAERLIRDGALTSAPP